MSNSPQLERKLSVSDATFIGLGSMLGAGVFVSFGPATKAAGNYLLLSLGLAAVVAWCNAMSSAHLASRYPESGGAYVFGTKQLGPLWGFLAGWAFIIGKLASCAAIALTIGHYVWPSQPHVPAGIAVALITTLNYFGLKKSTVVTKILVFGIILILGIGIVTMWTSHHQSTPIGSGSWFNYREITTSPLGILQGAAFMFFAFAGYARIATLGEEVKNPESSIPKAISRALAITIVMYGALALSLTHQLGISGLAQSTSALADATLYNPVVHAFMQGGAIIAASSSLLTLILGISRTTFAMARDRNLPNVLSRIHPKYQVPFVAEICVGLVVTMLIGLTNLQTSIGFSSFAVLLYYAIANASAWTLTKSMRNRVTAGLGFVSCCAISLSLPSTTVATGLVSLAIAALIWFLLTQSRNLK